jgi:peptidyl-prolyl cis-trans isomerase C
MDRTICVATLAASLLLLAGCEKKAEGQVAAVVNGEEITLQEVNAEMGDQVPSGVAANTARREALQRIVQRRLLAQAAKDDGLDMSPDYLIRRRTLDDALLVQLLAKKIGATIRVPEPRQIDALIKDRPAMFGNRTVLTIDSLRFAPSGDALLKQLEAAHSIDAVIKTLEANKIKFARGNAQIDTGQLAAPIAAQILALPPGEPFVLPQGNVYTAGVITGTRPNPLTGDAAKPIAVNAIRNEQLTKTVERRLKEAQATAKITYQPGFAPGKEAANNAANK